ncbi:MAG: metallophosphoesterase [Armatimonadota bacterium]
MLVGGCGSSSSTDVDPLSELTFFVTSDAHFMDATCPNPARAAIQAMNTKVIGQPNPAEGGAPFQTPIFALALGDVANGGSGSVPATDEPNPNHTANYTDQWNGFDKYFPLNGVPGDINKLAVPNYATGGNHDVYRRGSPGVGNSLYVANKIAQRYGAALTQDQGNVYYSFNVNGVHVAVLGRWPDETVCAWLAQDLAAIGPDVPVVLGLHYSFDDGEKWYTDAQRQKLADVIAGYRIVAICHGHVHVPQIYKWMGYDVFDDGSVGKLGYFGVMHITPTSLSYAQYLATWDADGNWTGGSWTDTFSKDL